MAREAYGRPSVTWFNAIVFLVLSLGVFMDCAFLAKITKVDSKVGQLLPCFHVEWKGDEDQGQEQNLNPLKMALRSWATSQNLKSAFFQFQTGPNSVATTIIKIEDI